MAFISVLDNLLDNIDDIQLRSDGLALWIVSGEDNSHVEQILEEYGGICLAENGAQSVWFFFSTYAYLATARLSVWARFNQAPIFVELFSATLLVSRNGAKTLEFNPALRKQTLDGVSQFQVWVAPEVVEQASGVLGLSVQAENRLPGMTEEEWKLLVVDPRLPYQSNAGWFVIMHAVGIGRDKKAALGWRDFFSHIEPVLQRSKFRYNVHDYFLMFSLEGIRQLRGWCKDYFTLLDRVKQESEHEYWPCVSAIIEKKGLNLSNELPAKVGVDWRQLTPDYPHMSKKTALLLGADFSFYEDRFVPIQLNDADWCSIAPNTAEVADANLLPNLVPFSSLGSYTYCYYCGQRSHAPRDCPTRSMPPRDPETWKQVSFLDFHSMRDAIKEVDDIMASGNAELLKQLEGEATPANFIYKAIYDIGWPAQLRMLPFFWRMREKDFSKNTSKGKKDSPSSAWTFVESFPTKRPEELDYELNALASAAPRDFRVTCLRGFAAMEAGNFTKARTFWKEAESGSPFPSIACWHQFLQARAFECQGEFPQALVLYDQVLRTSPTWTFVLYRKVVCEVKSGFSSMALPSIDKIIQRDGNFFNKVLIDPELERGQIQIFSNLVNVWRSMEEKANEEKAKLKSLLKDLPNWFDMEHPFAVKAKERISMLLQMGKVENFVTLQSLATGRLQIEREMHETLSFEAVKLQEFLKKTLKRMERVREEAAWFPFPRALRDFNKVYNESASSLNWAMHANMGKAESFKRVSVLETTLNEKVSYLEGRLRTLCVIRDSTLFLLTIVEAFFWIEIVGIIFIFVLLPLLLFYGDKIGMEWTANLIAHQRWEIQKVLFFLLSFLALGIAGLRTILRFDKIRDKVLKKAQQLPDKKKKKAKK